MDISAISTVTSQERVNDSAGISVQKTNVETATQVAGTTQNVAVDLNLGQNLDVSIGGKLQTDENEYLNEQQQKEQQWLKDKEVMMNIKGVKELQMRELAEQANQSNLTPREVKVLNDRLNSITVQVSAIDNDSIRTKEGKLV